MIPNPPTAQALTPTFSLFGATFTLADAQDAPDGWTVVEHLGDREQMTQRWRAKPTIGPALSRDDWAQLDAMLERGAA